MEQTNIKLSIVTPYGVIFDGMVKGVNLPGAEGEFGVLAGHCDLVSSLKAGVIEIDKENNKRELVAIKGGYVEVRATKVDILVNGAVAIAGSTDSDISNAINSAKTLLEEAASDQVAISSVISKMETSAKQLL